jgi:hypothetical protein
LAADITLGLASADFANQGTTTTVLHGNAAGNPSWSQIANADIANNAITYGKMQAVSAFSKLLGSSDAATAVTEITLGSGLNMTGTTLTATQNSFANPSASIGLAAVNGSAVTAMRSDGAPALSQAIVPTWTGAHTWSALGTFNLGLNALGATVNLNAGSNFATNINTGTSTGVVTVGNTTNTISIAGTISGTNALVFDGSTVGGNKTTFAITDPTAARTITFPDASGTVALVSGTSWNLGGNAPGGASILGTTDNSGINIQSGTGTINLGADAAAKTINIGNTTGSTAVNINAGTGDVTVNSDFLVSSVNGRIWGISGLSAGHTVYFQYGGDASNRIENSYGGQAIFRAYHGTQFYNNNGEIARFGTSSASPNSYFLGNVGIGQTNPTAHLHLDAGTAVAGTAPLKFTSGSLLTTPEAGAVEFLTDKYYGTTTGGARRTFAFLESPTFTTPNIGAATGTSLQLSGLTATRPVKTDGSKNLISGTIDLTSSNDVTGTLPVGNGGTGLTTLTDHGVLLGSGTAAVSVTSAGSAGQVLQSGGSGTDPSYSTATYPTTAGDVGSIITSDGTDFNSGGLTTGSSSLGANVTMTNANQYYTGPSVSLAVGTWYITGTITVYNSSGTAGSATARLWDATTTFSSSEAYLRQTPNLASISLSGIVTLTATTTIRISAASTQAASVIRAAALNNGVGNNASFINAVRIGP